MNLTTDQIETLKHTIGLTTKPYERRNFYFTAADDPEVVPLVELGLMAQGGEMLMNNGATMVYFHATDAGRAAAWAAMPKIKAYRCSYRPEVEENGWWIEHGLTASKVRHRVKRNMDEIGRWGDVKYADIRVLRCKEMDRRNPSEWKSEASANG